MAPRRIAQIRGRSSALGRVVGVEGSTTSQEHASGSREKRSYVRRAEAHDRLITATIELLRATPFAQVTTRAIAEHAGLNLSTIQTTFGSQLDLYAAVVDRLVDEVAETLQDNPGPEGFIRVFTHPSRVLRNRLVAWLLGEGVDPATFTLSTESRYFQTAFARQVGEGVDPQVAQAFTAIVGFAMAGYTVFGETVDLGPEEIAATMAVISNLRDLLPGVTLESMAPSAQPGPASPGGTSDPTPSEGSTGTG